MRSIRRSARFDREAEAIFPVGGPGPHGSSFERFDQQLLAGVEHALNQNAEFFPEVPGTGLRRVKTDDYPGLPALLIWFSIVDDDLCELESIESDASYYFIAPEEDEDEDAE